MLKPRWNIVYHHIQNTLQNKQVCPPVLFYSLSFIVIFCVTLTVVTQEAYKQYAASLIYCDIDVPAVIYHSVYCIITVD